MRSPSKSERLLFIGPRPTPQEISLKSLNNFLRYFAHRHTDTDTHRHTDQFENITSSAEVIKHKHFYSVFYNIYM